MVFRDDRLGDVADQFNRLNRVRLQVDDPAAAALCLTGNLHGDDVESLRLFLAQQPHLQAVREGHVIRVRSRQ
ncbi:MAG: hypothetical protein GAK31_00333 [Stenotrophomonas maltophilia]|uniref:DUF4974 domain-containing protein n=1 Tax=Stenotrophomonas maltophilia TaxID=40324 RepID=A0A7V8FJ89_STEMA|nr:MAG: hypothetical protein GAK31_00333 [Stenotrophomonas maltophilia]